MRDVVITGVGVVSPIGIGCDAFWDSLVAGRSGVRPITSFDTTGLAVTFGGEIRDFDPKLYVRPRKSLKVMNRDIQLGFTAADLAMVDSGIVAGTIAPDRFGVVFGGDMIYTDLADLESTFRRCSRDGQFRFNDWADSFTEEHYPLWLLKQLPNMIASHIAIAHDARGPNNTIVLGEVSSLLAIAEAASVIRRGWADVMIAGGAGSRLHPLALVARGDSIVSHRHDDCEQACRPFDRDRDGMVNGEGAGAFVLESYEHAMARRANVRARLAGDASRYERRPGRTAPLTGESLSGAIRATLSKSGLEARDVSHVNAHGLSTVAEDRYEAAVIRRHLGDVPVTALKSFFGHLGAGGGAVELAASVIGIGRGLVPPTLNYEAADPDCPVNIVRDGPQPIRDGAIVSLNVARPGQAAALAVLPPE
jgi:3-oxoacyl-[acyl-carrier-protein] synthase II